MASVQADSAALKAPMRTQATSDHAIHELTRSNGGTVKEFTNARGQVYAVTWAGPGKPDLRTLLGGYFSAFQSANVARNGLARRRPPHVDRSDLIIQTGGHMGYFWGVAYVPPLVPPGFSPSDLK